MTENSQPCEYYKQSKANFYKIASRLRRHFMSEEWKVGHPISLRCFHFTLKRKSKLKNVFLLFLLPESQGYIERLQPSLLSSTTASQVFPEEEVTLFRRQANHPLKILSLTYVRKPVYSGTTCVIEPPSYCLDGLFIEVIQVV